jgi:hypothetical protein
MAGTASTRVSRRYATGPLTVNRYANGQPFTTASAPDRRSWKAAAGHGVRNSKLSQAKPARWRNADLFGYNLVSVLSSLLFRTGPRIRTAAFWSRWV